MASVLSPLARRGPKQARALDRLSRSVLVRCERLPATCCGTPANKCHDISASLRPATLRQKEALDVRGLAGKRRGGRRLVEPRQLSAAFLDRPSSRCCPSI